MHPQRTRYLLIALLGLLLSACGATTIDPAPTVAPTLESSTPAPIMPTARPPTATIAPTAKPTAPPNATRAPAPTLAPTATPAPVVIQALYLCKFGFCSYTLGDQEAEELITALDPGLHGYALRPNGAGIVLAEEMYPTGETEILVTGPDLMNTRSIAKVAGAPSGMGGVEGFGVLGLTADGKRVLFEDQAQLFVAGIDGRRRRAVMDQRLYGASSTHAYALSPSGLRVLYTTTGRPNRFEIADLDTRALRRFTLPADRRAVALIDDQRVLVERFEPPFDPQGSNQAAVLRWSLGYEAVPISGAALGEPETLREDDGSFVRTIISNIAGDWLLVSDRVPRGDDTPEWPDPLWLLNVKTGARQEIHLPYYDNHSPVSIAIVR